MLRDLIVTVNRRHTAQIESWLLARGRLPIVFPTSNGALTEYLVEDASEQEIRDMQKLVSMMRRRFTSRDGDQLDTHESGWGENQQDEQ
jgi:hypothetical protein